MYSDLLRKLKQYLTLTAGEENLITHHAREQVYPKGAFFLAAPQRCSEIGFVRNGVFRYYTIDGEGNEITSMLIREGDFFTDLESFWDHRPSKGFIQAVTEANVLVFRRDLHQELTTTIPGWDNTLKRISQERLLEQLKLTREIVQRDARSVVRMFLQQYPDLARRVPDHYLASFLGITKYTFSRLKKEVENSLR